MKQINVVFVGVFVWLLCWFSMCSNKQRKKCMNSNTCMRCCTGKSTDPERDLTVCEILALTWTLNVRSGLFFSLLAFLSLFSTSFLFFLFSLAVKQSTQCNSNNSKRDLLNCSVWTSLRWCVKSGSSNNCWASLGEPACGHACNGMLLHHWIAEQDSEWAETTLDLDAACVEHSDSQLPGHTRCAVLFLHKLLLCIARGMNISSHGAVASCA